MKTIASSEGASCMHVRPNTRATAAGDILIKSAEVTAARMTAVPGVAAKFMSAIASSGVDVGATGGTFKTARWSTGIGCFRAATVKRVPTAGKLQRKMNTEASKK